MVPFQDRLELLQGSEARAKADQRKMKESLKSAEDRASRLELSQRSLEGELQRAQLREAELDAEAGALQERAAELRRKLGESEDRCASLAVSEERLSASLARAEQQESRLREQIQQLSHSLGDSRSSGDGLQEQVSQLQRALTASEHDRRLLQVPGQQTAGFTEFSYCLMYVMSPKSFGFISCIDLVKSPQKLKLDCDWTKLLCITFRVCRLGSIHYDCKLCKARLGKS